MKFSSDAGGLGRDARLPWTSLRLLYKDAVQRQAEPFKAVLVEGTSGVGKSTLIDALLRRHVGFSETRRLRTVVHLPQTHTYGPLARAEDDGTLTTEQNRRHLERIVGMLEWLHAGVQEHRKPMCFVVLDTLHLTHCARPGVVAWADVAEYDRRLAALVRPKTWPARPIASGWVYNTAMSADARLYAPATQRNRDLILAVLRRVLPAQGTVLELASGTGQHAVYFAPHLAPRRWQPSDAAPEQLASIRAWVAACPADNLLQPLLLDAAQPPWPVADVAAVVCINMIHIAPFSACAGLLRGAAALLPAGAPLYLYGPFRVAGQTAPSNEDFDRSLRSQDPAWGVRELDEVAALAATHGLVLAETVAMPASNLSVIFRREAAHA